MARKKSFLKTLLSPPKQKVIWGNTTGIMSSGTKRKRKRKGKKTFWWE